MVGAGAVGVAAAGRSARAEIVDGVVVAHDRVVQVHRPHGDHRRVVARRADLAIDLLVGGVEAEVARGHDHRDAGRRGAAHGRAQRVQRPALGGLRRQADVHDADVVLLGVEDHPLDAFDRVADGARAGVAEHLHVVDAGIRCHAVHVLLRRGGGSEVAPRRHRSHVRAVAVAVRRDGAVVGDRGFVAVERGAARLQRADACGARGPVGRRVVQHRHVALDAQAGGAVERAVVAHDARVEDGDADAAAVQARVGGLAAVGAHAGQVGAGDRFQRAEGPLGLPVGRDADDVAALRQLGQVAGPDLHRDRMRGRMHGVHRAAEPEHLGPQFCHRRVGRIADQDGLHMAHAADVARPPRAQWAGAAHFVVQVGRHLGGMVGQGRGVRRAQPDAGQYQADGGYSRDGCAQEATLLDQDGEGGNQFHVLPLGGEGRGPSRTPRNGQHARTLRSAARPPPPFHRSAADWRHPCGSGWPHSAQSMLDVTEGHSDGTRVLRTNSLRLVIRRGRLGGRRFPAMARRRRGGLAPAAGHRRLRAPGAASD